MAEPSLTLGFPDFQKAVGIFLGFGNTIANYSTDQLDSIQLIIDRGYRQFLYNARVGDQAEVHVWSFMSPTATIVTVAAQEDYDLPDNFASLEGRFYYDSANLYRSIEEVSKGRMLELRSATSTRSGTAQAYAIVVKPSDGTKSARWELQLFPTPDAVQTLSYQYNVLANQLSTAFPFAIGGMNVCEVILESMLAVAEQDFNDQAGVHTGKYQALLSGSVSFDRSQNTPQRLGYNADRSDVEDRGRFIRDRFVTVNGVIP